MAVRRWNLACLLAVASLLPAWSSAQAVPPVYTAMFTHVEDNTPGGTLGTTQSRQNYLLYRNGFLSMGQLAHDRGITWSLQPDWKILLAALLYEDATLTTNTNGKNFLRYLREDLGVVIDPHSHENGGYNYTDDAHLLDSLGVGGSKVVGGHVWDPSLPQFAEWDRFRVPVPGEMFPAALWRGEILMGSGTPNHVNDPVVSGVWRPRDRDHYFEDDPAGNIAAIGQFRGTLDGITELRDLYRNGTIPTDDMLTTSFSVRPSTLVAPGGVQSIDDTLITPLLAMRDSGAVVTTDFTHLVETWRDSFGARGFLYDAEATTAVGPASASGLAIRACAPNPVGSEAVLSYSLARGARIRLAIFDLSGRRRALLADGSREPGSYSIRWAPRDLESGIYFCRLEGGSPGRSAAVSRRIVIVR